MLSVGDRVVLRCPGTGIDGRAVVAGISSRRTPQGRLVDRVWLRLLEGENDPQLGEGEPLEIHHPGMKGPARWISRVLKVFTSDQLNAIVSRPLPESLNGDPEG